ncbi:MAG TPA: hypothetical protein VLY85_02180 [Thermoplasmata archaeon]|nr:hypothetical protein [Thermoplasmata archaeon]
MRSEEESARERGAETISIGSGDEVGFDTVRLGHDIRFVLAAVGGGGIRIAREVALRHIPYLETVAINCDPRVQELEEFDRRICLSAEGAVDPSTGGSPAVGGDLAKSAAPVLERIFEGATFVTIVASLGGGTGTGALPVVLDAACRASSALKVFVVKPFECELERRAVADRAIARLHFVESFVEKQQRGRASLQVLDNEVLARSQPSLPITRLERAWGDVVAGLIDRELIGPAEAVLEAERTLALAPTELSAPPALPIAEVPDPPMLPISPRMVPAHAAEIPATVELTFEVLPAPSPIARP